MAITTATGQTRRPRNWMRMVLLTVGLTLLVTAFPQPAGADQMPTEAGTNQAWGCNFGGGTATVETVITGWPFERVKSTWVTCEGGLLDGLRCINMDIGTHCWIVGGLTERPGDDSRPAAAEIAEAFESGSLDRIKAVVAKLEAAQADGRVAARNAQDEEPAAQRRVARDDIGDHDRDTNKRKHGRHVKQGGKDRKR